MVTASSASSCWAFRGRLRKMRLKLSIGEAGKLGSKIFAEFSSSNPNQQHQFCQSHVILDKIEPITE